MGQRPFAASSPWNTPVPAGAKFTKVNWPASTGYNYNVAWDSYSPAVYVASPSDPLVSVPLPETWGRPPQTLKLHAPKEATGAAGTDGEVIIVDGTTAHNFWQFKRTSATAATASAYGPADVVNDSGFGSGGKGAGILAIGASMLGGLLVQAETDAGEIEHAIAMRVDSKLAKSGFVAPAIAGDGGSSTGIVKEGERYAIPPGTVMPSGLSPLGQKLFRAMVKYGCIISDVAGGTSGPRAQANAYDDATMTSLWHDMGKIVPLAQRVG